MSTWSDFLLGAPTAPTVYNYGQQVTHKAFYWSHYLSVSPNKLWPSRGRSCAWFTMGSPTTIRAVNG